MNVNDWKMSEEEKNAKDDTPQKKTIIFLPALPTPPPTKVNPKRVGLGGKVFY